MGNSNSKTKEINTLKNIIQEQEFTIHNLTTLINDLGISQQLIPENTAKLLEDFSKVKHDNCYENLVFSGGGVKGLAHIGVLRMIDSLDIHIDYISATSMGSVVGALYAMGYSVDDIKRIALTEVNWSRMLTNLPPFDEVAFEEKKTESLVQQELFKLRCEFETMSTSTLYHAEDLPFSIKDICLSASYSIAFVINFTEFKFLISLLNRISKSSSRLNKV